MVFSEVEDSAAGPLGVVPLHLGMVFSDHCAQAFGPQV